MNLPEIEQAFDILYEAIEEFIEQSMSTEQSMSFEADLAYSSLDITKYLFSKTFKGLDYHPQSPSSLMPNGDKDIFDTLVKASCDALHGSKK